MRSAFLGVFLLAVLPATAGAAEITAATPVDGRVLDLALAGNGRVVALLADGVALYERDGTALRRLDHRPLEVTEDVRAPAGLIVGDAADGAFWVGTNRTDGASLLRIEGARLQEAQRAAALPFPGAAQGARFVAGTNLIEVAVGGLGSGPHLRAGAGPAPWAISPEGMLGEAGAGWSGEKIGSAAAPLGPGRWITSSADPPGGGDALFLVTPAAATRSILATFPAPAFVTAVAAHVHGGQAVVAVAVSERGAERLLLMEMPVDAR